MINLKDILPPELLVSNYEIPDVQINHIRDDSRMVNEGDVFVAVRGTKADGHRFIPSAIQQGALVIVAQDEVPEQHARDAVVVQVNDARAALAEMASAYYGHPSRKMDVVGITGTNGKTSVATMLYRQFKTAGYKTGLLSTIEVLIDEEQNEATHTTPGPLSLQHLLFEMAEKGCRYCFMEVSSHAAEQKRIRGIDFRGGIFTNITHEHLDYHPTFQDYINAKKLFFDSLSDHSFALVNADDKRSQVMLQHCKAKAYTYGLKADADYKGRVLEADFSGTLVEINGMQVYANSIGEYNASNMIAAYGTADLLGLEQEENLKALSKAGNIPGRMQVIVEGDIAGIVDYAHSPDALEKVLEAVRKLNKSRGRILTVVGCGGERDKEKRPQMGSLASKYADRAIFTSDNPRNEDAQQIIDEMKGGVDAEHMNRVVTTPDRLEAIRMACMLAEPGDVILVAGKGHEKYQIIGDKRHAFDDLKILQEQLKARA